ncbi:hypothetical protein R6Q57_014242 [Mikania cordata]
MKDQFSVSWLDYKQVKSEDESPLETVWSDEHECVPLKKRLKMLRAKAASKHRNEILIPAISRADDVAKKVNVLCDATKSNLYTFLVAFYISHNGEACCCMRFRLNRVNSFAKCWYHLTGIVHTVRSSPFQDRMLPERLERLYTKAQNDSVTHLPNGQHPSSSDDIENSEYFNEDLDHVLLKERQRMLLSRELVRPIRPAMECNLPDPTTKPAGIVFQSSELGSDICDKRSTIAKNVIFEEGVANIYASPKALKPGSLNGSAAGTPTWTYHHEGITTTKSKKLKNACKVGKTCSSDRSDINEKHLLSSSCKDNQALGLKPLLNVKVETLDYDLETTNRSIDNQISVKGEAINTSESLEDIIDHMMLGDRMRLLASRKFPMTTVYENFETSNDHKPKVLKSSQPFVIKRPCKRRKTVTDSIETALEEDAPGLLKVLLEKGVLVDEIKLYGANEGDELLDISLVDESFSDLEDVITKIFSQQQSLFKFAPIRCGGGEKTTYCLACLISLVEQARYLRVRKWPVEWGWCRDLQSFIFVFNKHNRIVLERPEYGYATYFFELVDALPVNWQIKRLVTAMKLSSCTRITLIENRALRVGDDLTEGEAQVLMEYGWIPDSGLGTMLNYCDRVVHDRKNDRESDGSEWRSKIGKLLTDGYNGGTIVPNDIPMRLMEYGIGHTPEIKLEY